MDVEDLDGEHVAGISAVIGYLHTGFEKNMEQKTWWKAITYAPRIDYVSFQNNELVFVLAVEKLLDIEVPSRATWMRMLLAELNRIHSHLVWLGTAALELGAISMFWYCFRERDRILDLFELVAGFRMHTRYFQVGGLAEDVPPGFWDECAKFVELMPKAVDDYEALVDRNEIWLERTQGVGLLSADDAIALGQSGPVLRGSGVDWDLRRTQPYLAYDQVDFQVPVYAEGDVYARYRVRMEEMRESVKIVEQAMRRMPGEVMRMTSASSPAPPGAMAFPARLTGKRIDQMVDDSVARLPASSPDRRDPPRRGRVAEGDGVDVAVTEGLADRERPAAADGLGAPDQGIPGWRARRLRLFQARGIRLRPPLCEPPRAAHRRGRTRPGGAAPTPRAPAPGIRPAWPRLLFRVQRAWLRIRPCAGRARVMAGRRRRLQERRGGRCHS